MKYNVILKIPSEAEGSYDKHKIVNFVSDDEYELE